MNVLYTYRVTWAGIDIPWHIEAHSENAARARLRLLLGGRAVPTDASFTVVGISPFGEPRSLPLAA